MLSFFVLSSLFIIGGCAPRVICDDKRNQVDVESIALKYDKYGFEISGSWQGIALKVGLNPIQVQKIEESTQNWNEYTKAAALAHNGCSGPKDRFGKLNSRYNDLKTTKELIEGLMASVPKAGDVPDHLKQQLNENFNRYYELVSKPI